MKKDVKTAENTLDQRKCKKGTMEGILNKSSSKGKHCYSQEAKEVEEDLPANMIIEACKTLYHGRVKVMEAVAERQERDTRGRTTDEKWREE